MRKLKIEEIRELSNRECVKKIAVENFLMSMGIDLSLNEIIANLELDAKSYKWNKQTINAILDGIFLAADLEKGDSIILISRELLE